jgi:hypothetical protein
VRRLAWRLAVRPSDAYDDRRRRWRRGPDGQRVADCPFALPAQSFAEAVAVAVETHRLVLHDSVTQVTAADAGTLVVTGSHGGASVVPYARAVRAWLYVFNDAGIGKDGAGIAALGLLEAEGQAAAAVSHASARIGEARDAWENGVVSMVNGTAALLGLRTGDRLAEVLQTVACCVVATVRQR